MTDYWSNRANQFRTDIQHIKEKMASAKDDEMLELKRQKDILTNELMVCLEAIESFG